MKKKLLIYLTAFIMCFGCAFQSFAISSEDNNNGNIQIENCDVTAETQEENATDRDNCNDDNADIAVEYAIDENVDIQDMPIVYPIDLSDPQTLQPNGTAITYTWKVESKDKVGEVAGEWKTVHQKLIKKGEAPQPVKYKETVSYKHSFSGTLEVTYKLLTAALGFDVRASRSKTVYFEKENASAGTWYCKLRPIYYKHKVIQRQYRVGAGSSGTPMSTTRTLTVKEFHHCEDVVTKTK